MPRSNCKSRPKKLNFKIYSSSRVKDKRGTKKYRINIKWLLKTRARGQKLAENPRSELNLCRIWNQRPSRRRRRFRSWICKKCFMISSNTIVRGTSGSILSLFKMWNVLFVKITQQRRRSLPRHLIPSATCSILPNHWPCSQEANQPLSNCWVTTYLSQHPRKVRLSSPTLNPGRAAPKS